VWQTNRQTDILPRHSPRYGPKCPIAGDANDAAAIYMVYYRLWRHAHTAESVYTSSGFVVKRWRTYSQQFLSVQLYAMHWTDSEFDRTYFLSDRRLLRSNSSDYLHRLMTITTRSTIVERGRAMPQVTEYFATSKSLKVIRNGTIPYEFLLLLHSNYIYTALSCIISEIKRARYWTKNHDFSYLTCIRRPHYGVAIGILPTFS